ncbi:MAG: hypothetical protein H6695_18125 [Deferribacteres bacterium]|nr:hypothetical protein [candidate division KSB1 bacterium]MCB9512102.1 hypothetical protein [Deferribacteres bacterium]
MQFNKNRIVLLATNFLILAILFSNGNSTIVSQMSLAVLFTILLWKRTDPNISRWFAVSILWSGMLFAVVLPLLIQN